MKKKDILSYISILVLLTGCTTVSPTPPVEHVSISQPPSLSFIISQVNTLATQCMTVRASGTLTITNNTYGSQTSCLCLIVTKDTDKILIKGYQALIPHYFTFIRNGEHFWYYIPRNDIVYTGTISALMKNSEYQLTLHPQYLTDALIPPRFNEAQHTITHQDSVMTTIFDKASSDTQLNRIYEMKNTLSSPTKITLYQENGDITAEINRSSFIKSGSTLYPRTIAITTPNNGTTITFKLNKILVNPEVTDSVFTVDIPDGVTWEHIT